MFDQIPRQQQLLILALVAVILLGVGVIFGSRVMPKEESSNLIIDSSNLVPLEKKVVVHLSGAVKKEGVYKVVAGARMVDVLTAAGGIAKGADLNAVNLAETVKDGQKISIPYLESSEPAITESRSRGVQSQARLGKININTASAKELDALPGIGPTMAKRIMEYRKTSSRFSRIDDLVKVKGISKNKLEKIREFITI